ncbi:MAG: radical SAM protein [Myxococcales bacterium]|nr:radical SAM protein [Myxococcales bacterium]
MANIGYIQVVRHCNHFCGFCSNPTTPYTHDLESMRVLVDDLVDRGYFGVVMTGGEPTLHPELPEIVAYASERGLHVRMITNGWRLADRRFADELARAGLRLVHVSIYSVDADVEARLRGVEGSLERAFAALDNAAAAGVEVNINSVINRLNADHLDRNVRYFLKNHPQVRHFVWNNLDPSMGRAEVNQELFVPRLADFELSLHRALRLLHRAGRTFRVERVPLCYMTEFAWASTETRKIIKGEERVVHFLDDKQTVRQTAWGHIYGDGCEVCSLRPICGGLFDQGGAYDPDELHPVFIDHERVVAAVLGDASDPSFTGQTLDAWRESFAGRATPEPVPRERETMREALIPVGRITDRGRRLFAAKRRAEADKAARLGVAVERERERAADERDEQP